MPSTTVDHPKIALVPRFARPNALYEGIKTKKPRDIGILNDSLSGHSGIFTETGMNGSEGLGTFKKGIHILCLH